MTTVLTGGGTRGRESLDDDVDLARDRALVTRAQDGDRAAFDDLYLRYYRRLYRFCLRRLHDSHEAEDVAQEAFARAWRALPTFGGDRRFYPWLSVIASHLCTDVLRRRNRSTPVAEFHQGNVASHEDGGEELMVAAVDSDLVAKAFTRLSDRHQRILHLREGSGWSYQRIADHEGVGITAVETLLWRARQALKREFASLAGVEGRSAAFLGGLLSLATLRSLFRLPRRLLSRAAATSAKGAAITAGSAVAATAMIIGATLTTPGHGSLTPNGAPGTSMSQELQHLLNTTAVPLPGTAGAQGTASVPAGSGTSDAGSASELPLPTGSFSTSLPSTSLPVDLGNVPGVGSTVTNLGNATTNLGSQLQQAPSSAQSLLGDVAGAVPGGALDSVTGLLSPPLSDASSLLGTVGTVGTLLSGAEQGTTGTTDTLGSATQSATAGVGTVVNKATGGLNQVTGLLGDL